jgi:hypothetical protein
MMTSMGMVLVTANISRQKAPGKLYQEYSLTKIILKSGRRLSVYQSDTLRAKTWGDAVPGSTGQYRTRDAAVDVLYGIMRWIADSPGQYPRRSGRLRTSRTLAMVEEPGVADPESKG